MIESDLPTKHLLPQFFALGDVEVPLVLQFLVNWMNLAQWMFTVQ